jgi:GST-like protein
MYLGDKSGRFFPKELSRRIKVNEWLMWQMGGFGPMLGRAHQFLHYHPGKAPFAEEMFGKEAQRLYGVLDSQLAKTGFVAGDYSIADMAIFPWAARHEWQRVDLNDFPHVRRWYQTIAARPAVIRGYNVPGGGAAIPMPKETISA